MIKSIYCHIPFCEKICWYCDFKRDIVLKYNQTDYINLLREELKRVNKCKMETIYLGGGTPNVLDLPNFEQLLVLFQEFIDEKTEFTIEINPESLNEEKVKLLKKYKVNRVSIGVQSTNEKILKLLNRMHKNKDVIDSIEMFRKHGITNISCDFIFNLPLQTKEDISNDIKFVQSVNVPHISWYSLEIKENSILKKRKYEIDLIQEEDYMDDVYEGLEKIGYKRYEVSNFAISEKYESNHNKVYWLSKEWYGIGYGAHGFEAGFLTENTGSITEYNLERSKLSDKDFYFQVLMMGLRLKKGIDISKDPYKKAYEMYKDKFNWDLISLKDNILSIKNINILNTFLVAIL